MSDNRELPDLRGSDVLAWPLAVRYCARISVWGMGLDVARGKKAALRGRGGEGCIIACVLDLLFFYLFPFVSSPQLRLGMGG